MEIDNDIAEVASFKLKMAQPDWVISIYAVKNGQYDACKRHFYFYGSILTCGMRIVNEWNIK